MRKLLSVLPLPLSLLLFQLISLPLSANPSGVPLVVCPVEPCRILDTRVSSTPIPSMHAIDAYVRGSALLPTEGAQRTDCGVPSWAEAVMVNVHTISPAADGYLKVNGAGRVAGVMGAYSRMNYTVGQTGANEILVSLCNFLYPAPATPCGSGPRYQDFQIQNIGPAPLHVAADVVAYYQREGQGMCAVAPLLE